MRGPEQWAHLASSAIRVEQASSIDGYGKPTFGASATYRGHMTHKREMVRTADGKEVESKHQFIVLARQRFTPTVRVTLSTGDAGSTEAKALQPLVLSVLTRFDQLGPHHTTFYF